MNNSIANFINPGNGYFWRIADGRVWSAAKGVFVTELPEGAEAVAPTGPDDKPLTYHGLPWLIKFYNGMGRNFPPGELAGPDELVKEFEEAIAARLNAFAREKGWDNIDRVLNQKGVFADNASAAQKVYDDTWLAAFTLEEQIRAGTISVADALAGLPEMAWPES